MKRHLRFLSAIAVSGMLFALWAFWLEPASLRVREYTLMLPHAQGALSGMRVAVLADLHVGSPYNGLDKLRKVVELTNAAAPDIVLIPGDMVIQEVTGGQFVAPEEFAPVLAGLKAPQGVWAVLGNHDWVLGAGRVRKALENNGIPVLDDRSVEIQGHGGVFRLAGVSDENEGPHDIGKALEAAPEGMPLLLMTHNPDIFPEVPERVDLTIAGHTHCGQVYIPLVGRPVIPSHYGQRYAKGHIVEEGKHLFVGCGIGTSIFPVRFLVPPEIAILVLEPETKDAAVKP